MGCTVPHTADGTINVSEKWFLEGLARTSDSDPEDESDTGRRPACSTTEAGQAVGPRTFVRTRSPTE